MFLVRLILPASIVMTVCFATFASGALELPGDEVQALRDIFNTLGKKDWNFSNPCSTGLITADDINEIAAVNCSNCTLVNGTESYRVVGIILKRQNLPGTLPPDLGRLPCLQVLDLSCNYLNGSIPSAWGSMKQLVDISLLGNRVTGSIPRALANIRTLRNLTVAFNQLSGNLPPELGNMSSIETLLLSSNNFIGELPLSFAKLTSLQDFRINDNQFSGQIPSYIQNWKNLTALYILASGLRGPIPSLDLLKNLTDLRISDLNGSDVAFPLKNISVPQWQTMILRNCNLTGPLPDQIFFPPGGRTEFTILDLSFNSLSGEIPSSFKDLHTVDNIYLTGNLFTGPIPDWILNSTKKIDLSFNNFTIEKSNLSSSSCQNDGDRHINLFKSSSMGNETNILSCSRTSLPHCSQRSTRLYINCGGKELVDVNEGTIYDADIDQGGPSNFFLAKDWSFSSTGHFMSPRKKAYILPNSTELISTDTTDPRLDPSGRISVGALVGILVGGAFVIILFVVAILWWKGCLGQRSSATNHDLRDLDLKTGTFTLTQIKTATNNFDEANKIGEGGFGSVYKGLLSDGTIMAVKQLSSKSKQGNREFLNEIGMISALQHPHLVKLYGCCVEGNQLLLVYEYMENNSLARALFGPEEYQLQLDWPTRHRICVGIARGLAYLHEESRLKIVHRDIKATNVLLDKNLNSKISDFGLAKLDEEDNTHISTRIAGTYGYMAPEYAMRGYLTDKADVYSFGIVALEIVSGKSNTSHQPKGESLHLLDWALVLKEKGHLLDLVDPRLGSNYVQEEVKRLIDVALLCTNVSAVVRPTMSSVVSMLEGGAVIPELGPNLSIIEDEMKVKALWEHFQDKKESSRSENSQTQSLLTVSDDPFTGSSTSAVDLYPINVDSSYWEKRV